MNKFTYETCCVHSTYELIHPMVESAREISLATLRRHCDIREWEASMGYATRPGEKGLRLKNDWHVEYFRSVYGGRTCYYIRHSAIEHIFTDPSQRFARAG